MERKKIPIFIYGNKAISKSSFEITPNNCPNCGNWRKLNENNQAWCPQCGEFDKFTWKLEYIKTFKTKKSAENFIKKIK